MNRSTIRIAGIVNDSITDGPGLRLTIFTQGCVHGCKGCHNRHTHDPKGGKLMEAAKIVAMIDENILLDGITFSGGEPFLQAEPLSYIAKEAQKRNLSVIAYTGFCWEELVRDKDSMPLIENCDYIIDGKYEESLKSLELFFKGSDNQRIIDVKRSLQQEKACIVETFSCRK